MELATGRRVHHVFNTTLSRSPEVFGLSISHTGWRSARARGTQQLIGAGDSRTLDLHIAHLDFKFNWFATLFDNAWAEAVSSPKKTNVVPTGALGLRGRAEGGCLEYQNGREL